MELAGFFFTYFPAKIENTGSYIHCMQGVYRSHGNASIVMIVISNPNIEMTLAMIENSLIAGSSGGFDVRAFTSWCKSEVYIYMCSPSHINDRLWPQCNVRCSKSQLVTYDNSYHQDSKVSEMPTEANNNSAVIFLRLQITSCCTPVTTTISSSEVPRHTQWI